MALHLLAHPKVRNGKRYCYYSLSQSYREEGRVRKRWVASLGKLTEEEAHTIRCALRGKSDASYQWLRPQDVECRDTTRFLDVSVFHHLFEKLKLSRVMAPSRGDVELHTLLDILVVNRCCEPKSKLGVTRWFPTTALNRLVGVEAHAISETRLYRSLPSIEQHHEQIEKHLFSWMQKSFSSTESSLYFYDLSSSYFEGEHVSLSAFNGHSKDHRPDRKQVVLGLLMNEKGLPFSWDVLRGNQGDAPTLKKQLKKFQKRFGIETATLVFDRGFLSNNNLGKIEEAGYTYVTGLDASQIETLLSLHPQPWLDSINVDTCGDTVAKQEKWHRFDETQFYCPLGVHNHRQTILLFDVARFRLSVLTREEKIEAFRQWVHKRNEQLAKFKQEAQKAAIEKELQAELTRRHLTPYVTCALHGFTTENQTFVRRKNNPYPSQGHTRKVRSFQIVVKEHNRHPLDGVFALITSKDSPISCEEMIHAYRQKYLIEAAFREMKSILKLRPWFVYKEEHVKAHYTICVLAYFLERLLDLKLEEKNLKDEGWTLPSLKEELKKIHHVNLTLGNTTHSLVQSIPDPLGQALVNLGLKKALTL